MATARVVISVILLCLLALNEASIFSTIKRRMRCINRGPPKSAGPASYMILAPKTIRAGLPYAVSVNILGNNNNQVNVNIKLTDQNGNTKLESNLNGLTPGKPKVAQLGIVQGNMFSSSSKLVVRGTDTRSGAELFQQYKVLTLKTDSLSILVQTDKAMYKPADLVRFRVVVSKPDLTPFKGSANVQIRNAAKTVIKELKQLSLVKGFASSHLQLSEEPNFGEWSIIVSVEDEQKTLLPDKYTKQFSVKKYVLPKFKVELSHPEYSISYKDIPVTVSAKYTYDKPLSGKGTVVIQQTTGHRRKIEEKIVLNEAGKADVLFKYRDLALHGLVQSDRKTILRIQATIRDEITGIERNATEELPMYVNNEKFVFVKQGDFFKPGLDYPILISVVTMDDKPLPPEADRTVYYKSQFWLKNRQVVTQEKEIQLDKDGTKQVILKAPKNAESLQIWTDYKRKLGEEGKPFTASGRLIVKAFKSPSNSFIQLSTDTDGSVNVGDNLLLTVTKSSSVEIKNIILQVISKGSVVYAKTMAPRGDRFSVYVPITIDMAPKSQIIVYAVRPGNSEVLVDAVMLQVDGLFRNNVNVTINPKECQPYNEDGIKNEVTVTVKADPDSFIGLLGVDQSVLLLKSGNDITQSEVEADMEKYSTAKVTKPGIYYGFWRRFFSLGGKDAHTLMTNTGMHVMTDAYLHKECIPRPILPRIRRPLRRGGGGGGWLFKKLRKSSVGKRVTKIRTGGHNMNRVSKKAKKVVTVVKPKPKVRSIFPDTWIFTDAITGPDGTVEHHAKVPDTISSFIVSAFATNERSGLGIATTPAKLKVFRPFFISLNLPYSIKQGEKFALQVIVFNYGDSDQTATITLERTDDSGFDFIKSSSDKGTTSRIYNERKVPVKGGGGTATVKFPIVATTIGHIKLLVKAIGQTATDAVSKKLLVEPEGVRVYFNKPFVLDFTQADAGSFESTVNMTPPREVEGTLVEGSERAEFSVLGDLMGPLLTGLGRLVRMPTGCGEQNMVKLVPNIIVMKYLDATGEGTSHPKLAVQAKQFIEIGYQRQQNYRRHDGSFSAFGKRDKSGSTWLTAYVLRSFADAKDYTSVDADVLRQAADWIKRRQSESGEFNEPGRMLNTGMQGGGGTAGVPLTAFVLTALLRAGHKNEKALRYLEANLEQHKDQPYAIAITAYALGLSRSSKFTTALEMLTKSAINEDGQRYWKTERNEIRLKKEWWQQRSKPVEIETVSYATMAYLLANRLGDALPCMRWLSARRNSLGGFASTQDTVVGIGALAEYAKKVSKGLEMNIKIQQESESTNIKLNDGNKVVLHRTKLGNLRQPVKITANGKGLALAQVSWYYNVRKLSEAKPFECTKRISEGSDGKNVTIGLCCKYSLTGRSNMAVAEIEVPSGFKLDVDALDELPKKTNKIKRSETSKDDTLASIYFEDLDNNFSCFDITSVQLFDVAEQKPSQIRLFDYYEPDRMIQLDYSLARVRSLEEQCNDCFDNMA